MQPTAKQVELLNRLANDNDGKILVSFLKDVITHYADVRNLTTGTLEEIQARKLFCDCIQNELIGRLSIKNESKLITEEYE